MPTQKPKLINLDLDLLRAFVAVADAKSFTRAGVRLGRTQSTISLQIKRLEEQLNAELFSRDVFTGCLLDYFRSGDKHLTSVSYHDDEVHKRG